MKRLILFCTLILIATTGLAKQDKILICHVGNEVAARPLVRIRPAVQGDVIDVERLKDAGEKVEFTPLLVVGDDGKTITDRDGLYTFDLSIEVANLGETELSGSLVLIQEGGYLSPSLGANLAAFLAGVEAAA